MSRWVLVLGLALSPAAGQSLEIPTDPESGVSIRVGRSFPGRAWAPLRVGIATKRREIRMFDFVSMSAAGTRRRSRTVSAGEKELRGRRSLSGVDSEIARSRCESAGSVSRAPTGNTL
jgi:hypothetical protein